METDAITSLLREVAAEAITPRFRSLGADEVDEKNPGDLVTVADREAEVLISRALGAAYPEAVILGEEASESDPAVFDRYAAADHAFTVDPVDGTRNFVRGSPEHAVMVAELRRGEVVRAWIWQPQHETAYVAERGAGAFRDGVRLTTSPPSGPAARWHGVTSRRSWIGRSLPGHGPLTQSWVCCGVDYPQLVAGAADYVLYGRTKPWDHAPGTLLVTEAGGAVSAPDGSPYDARVEGTAGLAVAPSRDMLDEVTARWREAAWR